MEEGSVAKVLNDFLTVSDGEISLKKGEIAQVLEKIDRHWWYGCCGGKSGKFPASYLIAVDVPSLEDGHELFAAIADFPRQQDGDLSFSKGELIVGLSQVNEDWWHGKIGERIGIFPTTYTWQLDSKPLKAKLKPTALNRKARVRMNMKAQLEEEMDLHQGDILTVTEVIDKNWYRGICGTQEGVFPSAYVELLEGDEEEVASNFVARQPEHIDKLQMKLKSDVASSCEVQFPASMETTHNANASDNIFEDDYFKVNMPSMYRKSEEQALESLVEIDVVPYGITLYPFYAQFDNELSFHEGEIITLCRHVDKDWVEGKIDGKKGIFPKSYINILVDCESYSNVVKLDEEESLDSELSPNLFAKVLYNFDAQMTGDLTVHKDEVVWIIAKANEDWCEVKNQTGKVGLCPRNHLTPHLYPQDVKNKFVRGTSLAADNLLGFFSTAENASLSLGGESQDLHMEDHTEIQASNIQRHSIHFAENTSGLCTTRFEPTPLSHNEMSWNHPVPQQIEEQVEVELRCVPQKPQSCDRLPHRPAPPVPVPGHKPVRRSLRRLPAPGLSSPDTRVSAGDQPSVDARAGGNDHVLKEHRKKNAEQRQNVISELVFTEKEYVRDLKITYETFNLHKPRHLEERGIDVKVVFGNILEVMHLAEDLLDKLQLAMKGKDEDDQCVGACFIELADQMKCVYGQYCMNHNNAMMLLEKYESVEEIQRIFNKGIETLRYQIACFDMGSILIKPVQRILKYPLILNELIKCTEDDHQDKNELLKAVKTMMDVATYLNEYKRRKDIVSKYLDDGNTTISGKMARLSLHSVAKKSSRLGVMLASSLFGAATKDPLFDEHELIFHTMEKTARFFLKDVEIFLHGMQEKISYQLNIGTSVINFFQESGSEAEDLHRLQQHIDRKFFHEFRKCIEKRVLGPLNVLIGLFEGPAILVQKRHDKLLDYDGCYAKAEKNKENRLIQEELMETKSNYEALNTHLLEELPTLNKMSCEVLIECLATFVCARKMLSGKITKEYLALIETPLMKSSQGDAVESFPIKHSLVWNQLGRFSFCSKVGKTDTLTRKQTKSPVSTAKQDRMEQASRNSKTQSLSQQAYLQSRYPRDMLYCTIQPHRSSEDLELSIDKGLLVGVIKKHDPLGDKRIWFVDDGSSKGFVPSTCLEPLYQQRRSDVPEAVAPRQRDPLPPPSYDEVVSSAESSPLSAVNRISDASEHEYQQIVEPKVNHYEEISEIDSSLDIYQNIQSSCDVPTSSSAATSFYYAMYDFAGGGTNMLAVRSGQVLLVLEQRDFQGNCEWWLVEDRFGKKGFVPGNFLRRYEQ